MKIRRIHYNIDYIHILTFREEYKKAVIPYFGFDHLRYGIENENTINESIKLLFQSEAIAISFRKEGLTIIFDGDVQDLKSQNGVMRFFWDIYDNVKSFSAYKKSTRHTLTCHGVEILDNEVHNEILKNPNYFTNNPFGPLKEFNTIYEFEKNSKNYKFEFGNYSEKDIPKHDLYAFKSEANKDLVGNFGLMCRTEISEKLETISFSKYKNLLTETEGLIKSFTN